MKLILYFIKEEDLGNIISNSSKYSNSHERGLINTFLAEMDGFQDRENVFVLGATNSENDLDSAALRPGRFDKTIHVPLPDLKGREDIFKLYIDKIKMPVAPEVSAQKLAKMTPGFSGAEIENMVNIAIIDAVDKDSEEITKEEFGEARDRVVLGIKRRIKKKNIRSLLQTAIHEAGHTLVCYKDKICRNGIHKVSILQRGDHTGKTSTMHDDLQGTREEFISMIDMSLGGLVSEELYFGGHKMTTGCGNDLSRATNLAKAMVKQYAMDTQFGYMVVDSNMMVGHKISGETRNMMDVSVSTLLNQRSKVVRTILESNIADLKKLAQKLVEYEELSKEDIEKILTGKEDEIGKNDKKREFSLEAIAL